MVNQVALVAQTAQIKFQDLTAVAAAIQKQVTRDVSPIWNIEASVDAFASLDDVPVGYWQVLIDDSIPFDAAGIHLNNDNGQPYALVTYSDDWSLTTSHEVVEMLIDPSGNRTVAVNSPKPGQGRVLVLVETCDPSEGAKFAYTVNGVLVSDFYTPHFFDPVKATGVRYSYTGALTGPLEVLDEGYMSWWDPQTKHVFQLFVTGTKKKFVDLGSLPPGFGTLRSFTDSFTNKFRRDLKQSAPKGAMLSALGAAKSVGRSAAPSMVDQSSKANADSLRAQIVSVVSSFGKGKKR
jgi:hypothetical protein